MKRKTILSLVFLLAGAATILLMLRQPDSQTSETMRDSVNIEAQTTQGSMGNPSPPHDGASIETAHSMDVSHLPIVEALDQAGFTRFASVVKSSGLATTLAEGGIHTCFAPTDATFDQLPASAQQLIATDPKHPSVLSWLKYHFAQGETLDTQALGLERGLWTLDERLITIWVTPGKIRLDKVAEILRPNIRAADGIIHGIGSALKFPDVPSAE
jgi:uncharacterized surface protein with fasciclin (FAS1) repeats